MPTIEIYDHDTADEVVQVGLEAAGAAGTAVPALVQLASTDFMLKDSGTYKEFTPPGADFPTTVQRGKGGSDLTYEGPISYIEDVLLLDGLYGYAAPASSGVGCKTRTWLLPMRSTRRGRTYTMQRGDTRRCRQAKYVQITGYKIKVNAEEVTKSGDAIGHRLDRSHGLSTNQVNRSVVVGTDGTTTYTYTVAAVATTPLALGTALAADVRAALEALPAVGRGNVRVTLVALATGTVTWDIEWMGDLGQAAVALTGAAILGASPSNTITTPTASAAPTILPIQVVDPNDVAFSWATTAAGLATADPLPRGFELEMSITGRWTGFFPVRDNTAGFAGVARNRPGNEVTLLVGNDNDGLAFLDQMEADALIYFRKRAIGPAFEAGHNYEYQIDMALRVNKPPEDDERDALAVLKVGCTLASVPTWGAGQAGQFIIINNWAGLS